MLPPWPDEPGDPAPETLIEAEYSTAKRRNWRNDKLCKLLGISADVARDLDLKTIRPADVAREADQARPLQADMIRERREWLRLYMLDHGGDWTTQRVVNLSALSPFAWNNRMTQTRT